VKEENDAFVSRHGL